MNDRWPPLGWVYTNWVFDKRVVVFYSYQTENGISASESGKPVDPYGSQPGYAIQGQYSYQGNDGNTYTVTYTADGNGFQPQGAHLPTPVPTEYPTPQVPVTQPGYQGTPSTTPPHYQPYEPTY